MAEFTNNLEQTVESNQDVLLNTTIGCCKRCILHREESGIVTLRGIVNNPYGSFARYQCFFIGNIALPEGGTVAPISVAIAISGEALQTSTAIYTPASVSQYGNVTAAAIIDVPSGCCEDISVRNISNQAINVKNAKFVVTRVA